MEIPRLVWYGAIAVAVLVVVVGIWRAKRRKPTSRGIG